MKRAAVVLWVMMVILSGITTSCTEQVAPEIPEYFTTYTDEYGIFSISYPEDWTSATEIPPTGDEDIDMSKNREQLAAAIESDSPLLSDEMWNPLFSAFDEGISLTVGAWSPDDLSMSVKQIVDGRFEYTQQQIASGSPVYEGQTCSIIHRTSTTISGREAYLVETVITYSTGFAVSEMHVLSLYTRTGKVIIYVSCGAYDDNYDEFEYEFNIIVKSLRILR